MESIEKKNITIIGLGGVGGYFGFKLAQTTKNDSDYTIAFVARNKTFEIVKTKGLTLLSAEHDDSTVKPDSIFENVSEIEKSDLILICVKEYDLENVCRQIKDKVTETTIILALMNGADIYERVRKVIPNGVFMPSCVYVASHIKEKGVVEHKGITGKIVVGRDPENKDFDVSWVMELLKASGADIIFKDDSFVDIWTKFFFIASFGLVSARYNKTIGQVCEEELPKGRATSIMEEIKLIANKKNIDLPSDISDKTFEKAATFPYATPTSLQLDVNSNNQDNELELFAGAIMNFGKQYDIDTPETNSVYEEIKRISEIEN